MRKVLIYILGPFLFSMSAIPESLMMPGLWEISFKIRTDGRVIIPAEQIKKTLAPLTRKQQIEVLDTLKARSGIDEDGNIQVCYTPNDLDLREETITPLGEDCLSKVIMNSPHKVVINFACANGITGSSTRFIKGSHHYSGVTKVTGPTGKVSEIIYQGKYHSSFCEKTENIEI